MVCPFSGDKGANQYPSRHSHESGNLQTVLLGLVAINMHHRTFGDAVDSRFHGNDVGWGWFIIANLSSYSRLFVVKVGRLCRTMKNLGYHLYALVLFRFSSSLPAIWIAPHSRHVTKHSVLAATQQRLC